MIAFRRHKGVKIYRTKQIICGSDMRELRDGTLVKCKPKYTYYYGFRGAYPYDTIGECRRAIDRLYAKAKEHDVTDKDFIGCMNTK